MTVEEIKKRKKELGYSNEKLASLSGVPIGTVNKVLSGQTKNPRYETIRALGRAMIDFSLTSYTYDYFGGEEHCIRESQKFYKNDRASNYPKQREGYTIEDYYNLPDDVRVELIDGKFYDLSAPSFAHQEIISYILVEISNFIRKNGGECKVLPAPFDVKLDSDDKTILEPDLIVCCDPKKMKDWGLDGAPDFVLEVVSPSSGHKDYIIKANKYLNAGVREYWIIDPKKRRVTAYNFMENGAPHIQGLEGSLGLKIYDDKLQIDLSEIGRFLEN